MALDNRSSYSAIVDSPVGRLGIQTRDGALRELDYLDADCALQPPIEAFTRRVAEQLARYFESPARRFSIPVALAGTAFQRRVWQALIQLSVGQVLSYGALATQLHTGARAVGNACRVNRVPIVVPCHRIVSARGLGGYGGLTSCGDRLSIKQWLLDHERAVGGNGGALRQ